MATILPGTEVIFRRTTVPSNDVGREGIPLVIGPSSAGPVNTLRPLNSFADAVEFGFGPGIQMAMHILVRAGGPVYFMRSTTSTASVVGTVVKTPSPASVGTPVKVFGSVLVPGANFNGDVLVTAKVDDVSLTIVDPGVVTATTTVGVVGPAITVTLKRDMTAVTETGTGLAGAINGSAPALALVGAVAQGTGASLAGVLSATQLNPGSVLISALKTGVSFEIIRAGNSTPLSSSYNTGTGLLTLNLATNANGEPTTTAAQAVGELAIRAAANPGVFQANIFTLPGNGLLSAKSATSLVFGSNGTATASGTANDMYDFDVVVVRGGTVGGASPIGVTFSPDNSQAYTSSEKILTVGGVVSLSDGNIDTGVTLTLTGTLAVGDRFKFSSTLPRSSNTEVLNCIDVAAAQTLFDFGYVTSSERVSRTDITLLDAKLQSLINNKFWYGVFTTRDIDVVGSETEQAWMDSINSDFAGFNSANGLVSKVDGYVRILSDYTKHAARRPALFDAMRKNSRVAVHQNIGETDGNSIDNLVTPFIYHDEAVKPGLYAQRSITTRTYIPEAPGQYFFTGSTTLSDPTDGGSRLLEYVKMKLGVGFRVKKALFPFLLKTLAAIPKKESDSVPAGALASFEAGRIAETARNATKLFLLSVKKQDGKPSVQSEDNIVIEVPRNYNYLTTRQVVVKIAFTPGAPAEQIRVEITVALGEGTTQ